MKMLYPTLMANCDGKVIDIKFCLFLGKCVKEHFQINDHLQAIVCHSCCTCDSPSMTLSSLCGWYSKCLAILLKEKQNDKL